MGMRGCLIPGARCLMVIGLSTAPLMTDLLADREVTSELVETAS
jgi:hypothetical protein